MTEKAAAGLDAPEREFSDIDDPVVLRELLRQAREHLRLRESIDRLLAENAARTEAMLLEARAARDRHATDPETLRADIAATRAAIEAALAAIERVETLVGTRTPESMARPASTTSGARDVAVPGAVEVLIHEVHAPALARSLQRYLSELEGVQRAEVRELAEGLLRITVEGTAPLNGETLAAWEPQRSRTVRTNRPDVLEIELT